MSDDLDEETIDRDESSRLGAAKRGWSLTVAWHPDPARTGDLFYWPAGSCEVSRREPMFGGAPLGEPGISRAPFVVRTSADGSAEIRRSDHASAVEIDGALLERTASLAPDAAERGVVIELARRVVLVLRRRAAPPKQSSIDPLLLGVSEGAVELREQVAGVADLDVSVLIGGESGSGKELVARSIVAQSKRRDRPFVAVNLAATPPSVGASELFGHSKGAFTGADRAHPGLFVEADTGTLFLDEIGDSPVDIQVMLLRALETSEVRPVGGSSARTVDVRVLAATDLDLERAIENGAFRQALLQRLAGYRIQVPPLRERRDDIGLLFAAFVKGELTTLGLADRLEPADKPWLGAALVARLVRASWPGNVRQLRNAARQLVIANRAKESVRLDPILEQMLDLREPPIAPGETGLPDDDAALLEILRRHRFELRRVARVLGVARSTLYARIEKSPLMRKARDLGKDEIEAAREQARGHLETMAAALEVSPRGLTLRMRELGLRT